MLVYLLILYTTTLFSSKSPTGLITTIKAPLNAIGFTLFLVVCFFISKYGYFENALDAINASASSNSIANESLNCGSPLFYEVELPKTQISGEAPSNSVVEEDDEDNWWEKGEDYDAFYEILGPELTWGEWIRESVYNFIFGKPKEPFIPFEQYVDEFFTKYKVPQHQREALLNEIWPPYVPPVPPSELPPQPFNPLILLREIYEFLLATLRDLVKDVINICKFSIYYTDQTLRYLINLVPISKAAWRYLGLLELSICALGYMFALMFHEETLYTRIMFHDMRHIPIREIYFFHEYFLCWATIIGCLLCSTLVYVY